MSLIENSNQRVAAGLNGRPRKTLNGLKPIEVFDELIAEHYVAMTGRRPTGLLDPLGLMGCRPPNLSPPGAGIRGALLGEIPGGS